MLKVSTWERPSQLCSCASSGRAWRLWAARHSQEEAVPLDSQPLPRVLERAASKAADLTGFDHAGTSVSFYKYAMALPAMLPATIAYVYLGASVADAARSGADAARGGDDGGETAVRIALLVAGLVVTFTAVIALSIYAKRQLRRRIDAPSTGLGEGEGGTEGEEVGVTMPPVEGSGREKNRARELT